MKKLLVIVLVLMFCGVCFASEKEIRPRYNDFTPNDGFMDAGTRQNPYVIEDDTGRELGEIKSRYHDFQPDDGFMDKGTWQNPYIYTPK